MRIIVTAALAMLMGTGCFRTVYSNFTPDPAPEAPLSTKSTRRSNNGWQSFFLYGWAPSEKVIDAAAMCGGAQHVARIETQRSFAEGLVAAFAGFYINIYSPWDGKVVCEGSDRSTPSRRQRSAAN